MVYRHIHLVVYLAYTPWVYLTSHTTLGIPNLPYHPGYTSLPYTLGILASLTHPGIPQGYERGSTYKEGLSASLEREGNLCEESLPFSLKRREKPLRREPPFSQHSLKTGLYPRVCLFPSRVYSRFTVGLHFLLLLIPFLLLFSRFGSSLPDYIGVERGSEQGEIARNREN